MKFLKLFENFELDEYDLKAYCEDYWDVDPEYLFEIIQHEVEDNSLKTMRFIFEKGDKYNLSLIVSDKHKLSAHGFGDRIGYWKRFFEQIRRVEKEKWYPEFDHNKLSTISTKGIIDSSIYKTSVYFEDKSVLGGSAPNIPLQELIYFPEMQLGFDRSSIIEDGNIGDWEDHFNSLFEKVNIPYAFDGDSGYFESDIIYYTLYHT